MSKQQTIDGADEVEQSRMGLGEHLAELRTRLIRCVAVMLIAFFVFWAYRHPVVEKVQGPWQRAAAMLRAELATQLQDDFTQHIKDGADMASGSKLSVEIGNSFKPGWPEVWEPRESVGPSGDLTWLESDGGFFPRMRVCFWLSVFVTGPFILWQIWGFIASGLYRNERRMAYAYFPISLGLFFGGVFFGYFVLVPYALFFLQLDGLGIQGFQTIMGGNYYLAFLKGFSVALGFVFQLPIVMVAMTRLGLVDPAAYAQYRKHTLVGALVVGAILTPPDPVTQLLMAGPVIVLYEIGLRVARLVWTEPL
ncbi:MAG: twin-arginine translocase subunit TatC, partial [Rhodobacteraceae bacterium]|nr:twin-arginine translocase subunit TatC [Paracoccaceae bacterium]